MNTKRSSGLGRGLGELFQRTDQPAAEEPTEGAPRPAAVEVPEGSRFVDLPVEQIAANPKQPRTVFDEDLLRELVASIHQVGVLQPVVVRPLGDDRYELVMGERRLRACRDAGLETIPAIVRETEDAALLRDALLENLHRANLNPLEEAAAYQQMLQEFDCTQDELSARVNRSRPQISNTIRLLKLPPTVQRRVAAGVLSAGHARALLMVEDPAAQERLAQRVVAEGLSVRAVEELVTVGEGGRQRKSVTRELREIPLGAARTADRLADRLETSVKVQMGRTRGRLIIEFASVEDLERIAAAME